VRQPCSNKGDHLGLKQTTPPGGSRSWRQSSPRPQHSEPLTPCTLSNLTPPLLISHPCHCIACQGSFEEESDNGEEEDSSDSESCDDSNKLYIPSDPNKLNQICTSGSIEMVDSSDLDASEEEDASEQEEGSGSSPEDDNSDGGAMNSDEY
jgi:hypothetical protein